MTQAEFNRDNYGCEKDARQSGYYRRRLRGCDQYARVLQALYGGGRIHVADQLNAGIGPDFTQAADETDRLTLTTDADRPLPTRTPNIGISIP